MANPIVEIDFTVFPKRHTCVGEDVSPEIRISRLESPYCALILSDPGAPGGEFAHWLIWNIKKPDRIPENIPKTPEVSSPFAALQGTNDFGKIGYNGPCPPKGSAHEYYFNLYGLDAPLQCAPGATLAELKQAMKGHEKEYSGTAVATFRRE
ncbi:YbhB/YbcL family Raf kinase inhibitor-like protein [Methanofollis fontis]|uniref:YbhB/YbcL family Raf kinase inhibitor-like protein n=1 Tax=Methanofollis fontis TaxID=2052832 RepID=A0A483CTV7_9EURY|nr:YbhB/YbcL family Raf kinase inhibitor-like protein [Methanofollis fontis]TAJ44164.1 YbhB/YbcL family Raf kinase inhibitor-like protein [Methanofollis fontis]